MGNFAFFGLLSFLLIGVKYKGESRAKLHQGGWFLKICLWLLFNIIPFFLPNGVASFYSHAARFGSGLFIVIQMLILLDFTHAWNDSWVSKESNAWLAGLLGITVASFGLSIAGIAVLYHYFHPAGAGKCSMNVTFVTLTLVAAILFSVISLLPKVDRGSLFPSAIIALYTVYLCFSALASEPLDYACNGMGDSMQSSNMWIGMIIALLSVVYSALRASECSESFSLEASPTSTGLTPILSAPKAVTADGKEDQEMGSNDSDDGDFEPVEYSYSFFHIVFALASMYSAMILTSWASASVEESKDSVDIGWTSVWVKIVSQWMMSALYIWTLVAPVVLKDRDFSF